MPPSERTSVRAYTRTDAESAAKCLSDALSDDPLAIATFGVAPWPGFFRWMNWQLFESFGMGEVAVDEATGDVVSAALWEEANMTVGAALRGLCMFLYMVISLGVRPGMCMMSLMSECESKRQKYAPTALHLQTMGTVSAAQGKGIGRNVLQSGIKRADARGVPCYLESSNPRNVPFYKRLGFKVVEEFYPFENGTFGNGEKCPGKGPVCTLMLREFEKE